ncbi:MAG: bifunctional riboflavin kinase/FAD synthetase [Bradyrhizobium sp.]|nr:MAG: bifunctional riboflavin kinase/FAD synthetase [Bradyrhizobium sp.]
MQFPRAPTRAAAALDAPLTQSPPQNFAFALDPTHPPPGLEGAVYAIGNFDGVHRGHEAVIARTKALAAERGAPSAILTFEPHPGDYFAGRPVVFRLTPAPIKTRILRASGLAGVVALSFDAALAQKSAAEFIETVLVARLGVGAVIVGWDFHFGKARGGTPEFLRQAGAGLGFGVEIIDKVETGQGDEREVVSSSAIRRALERGDVEAAARGLGRDYLVEGVVAPGQQLGRELGVPTANLALEATSRLAYGVYAVRARVGDAIYDGVASFGVRPTVEGGGAPLLEVHLFDFSGDLYGQTMTVAFVARLRDELKFASLDALKAEMARDMARARQALSRK